ncbi:alpha/beta hydrolase [Curtobacterium sp. VKM Ac-2887]|uniref:alpha/beta hydrolase n=1 Tax=Curtobacterium sp. VKM Ac-2887 TaxID=2783819 RepID=UPI00188AE298|nr:alpha/beta hydrolase [Curtobacterium sp. VKM Ac-2887]MBF4585717.1 alpha/beta hydrolase [Curtobacterium sp. VKM Ac-2887]
MSKPEPITIRDRRIATARGTVDVRDYAPRSAQPVGRPLLWVHGGGFTSGGLNQRESDAPARHLARAGFTVRTIDYRLAPAANPWREPDLQPHHGRYPAGLDDVVAVAVSLSNEAGGGIHIGGASAGANLAAAAAIRLEASDPATVRSLFLAYGTFHAELPDDDTVEADLRGRLAKWAFNPEMLRRMNLNYVGDPALLVPGGAFPGGTVERRMPPTFLLDASNDRLRRSGHAFASELRRTGTDVRELVLTARHGFLGAERGKPFAEGMSQFEHWLRSHA